MADRLRFVRLSTVTCGNTFSDPCRKDRGFLFEEKAMQLHKSGIGKAAVAWLAALMLLITSAGAALADTSTSNGQAVDKALTWMHTQQQPDGSFAGFGAGSTVDAVL